MQDIGVRLLGVWKLRVGSNWSRNTTAIVLRTVCTCVTLSIGLLRVDAQITTAPVIFGPEHLEILQDCTTYQNALTSTGITRAGGASAPGRCRAMDFQPLFNGVPLPANWQSSSYKYRETLLPGKRVCIEASGLKVTMSALMHSSVLGWFVNSSTPACGSEGNRIANAADSAFGLLTLSANGIVSQFGNVLHNDPPLKTCQRNRKAAELTLQQLIWERLHVIAQDEQAAWTTSEQAINDPGIGAADRCTAHCGLCDPGWAGTIQCTKTVTDTGPYHYQHSETQTWFVGGTPTQVGALRTVYPTAWTMTATGRKDGNPSWTGNATGAGTLAVSSDAQGMHFGLTNSPIEVFNAFVPQMWAANEWQFAEIIQPIDSNNQVNGSNTDTMHAHSCGAPIAPGTAVCTVVCTWNMQKQ